MQQASPAPNMAVPELSFVVRMAESDGRWQLHGDYAIWSGTRTAGEAPYVLHEWSDTNGMRGVIPIPVRQPKPILHRIALGTPYHVSGLFGFWIAHDVDAVWLEAPKGDVTVSTLMVGGTAGKPDAITTLWVCPKCAASFGAETINIGGRNYGRFLETALARVRAFNADPKLRTCPKCSAVHPPTYGFYADADTAEEKAARNAG
jgi:rubredoxin